MCALALRSVPASSLIFLVIIALWAAYLVPNAIRKHRRTAEARQADRDSQAMRVVVRRGAAPVGQALAAAAANAVAVGASSRPVLGPGADAVVPAAVPLPVRGRSRAAVSPASPVSPVVARRRRVLAAAGIATGLGWGIVLTGLATWWAGAVPTVALMLVVAALSRHGASAPQRRAQGRADAVVLPVVRPAARVRVPVQRDERPSPLAGDDGWQPVPVPLPTYLLKDRARTWDPVSPALAAQALPPVAVEEHETLVIDLRDHVRAVGE